MISYYLKYQRKKHGFTQHDLAHKAGVSIKFIRELEQQRTCGTLDKVNQILSLFGDVLAPRSMRDVDYYEVCVRFMNVPVLIKTTKRQEIKCVLIEETVIHETHGDSKGWKYMKITDMVRASISGNKKMLHTHSIKISVNSIESIEEINN